MLFHKNSKKVLGIGTIIVGVLVIISMVMVYVLPAY